MYVQKHNPFIYFDDIRTNSTRCNKIVPFTQFATDLQNNSVPNYAWITPNQCNDTHDCSISTGDNWLKTWVAKILASSAWKQNGVLFITYDEGSSSAGCCTYATGGHIVTLVISPLGKAAYKSSVAYDHYSLLRTIEDGWGLSELGKASCTCSPPMSDFFGASAPTPTATRTRTPTPTAAGAATATRTRTPNPDRCRRADRDQDENAYGHAGSFGRQCGSQIHPLKRPAPPAPTRRIGLKERITFAVMIGCIVAAGR